MQGLHPLPEKSTDIKFVFKLKKSLESVNLATIVIWIKDEILWTFIEAKLTGLADVETA